MKITTYGIILFIVAFGISPIHSQNYFTGELFEAYEWDISALNDIDMELESQIILRRRLLSKKEDMIGKKVKENKQFFDEVVIRHNSKLEVIKVKDDIITIMFDGDEALTLQFEPDNQDNENYSVVVDEMKGEKGVTQYNGIPFRVLNGSRLIIGKLKKKNLPLARTTDIPSNWSGNGSGVIIDRSGYIVTNYHVIEDVNDIVIVNSYISDKELKAKVILSDEANDLAILKITDTDFQIDQAIPFGIGQSSLDVGSEVFTLGFPLALGSMGQEVKFADGTISAKTGYKDNVNMYQISVPTQPGNSGGPLFDANGNLVGIVNAKVAGVAIDNVSYAIKSSYVQALIDTSKEDITIPDNTSSGDMKSLIKIYNPYVVMVKVK